MNKDCEGCGKEDCEPIYTECCGMWLCDDCLTSHDNDYYVMDDYFLDADGMTNE